MHRFLPAAFARYSATSARRTTVSASAVEPGGTDVAPTLMVICKETGVVERFKVVKIDHEQRELKVVARRKAQFRRKYLVELPPVRDAG